MQFVKYSGGFLLSIALAGCAGLDLSQVTGQLGRAFPTNATYPSKAGPVTLPPAPNPSANAPDMLAYRVLTAKKIMQINSGSTYSGTLPDPMASIPIIEITLNGDGSIRGLDVRRTPRFYPETAQTAMDAIRRAAPFGSVAHLPQPWVFNETFLFNDDLKFQLHSLQP